MSVFSFLRKKLYSNKLGKEIGYLLVGVAAEECGHIQKAWSRGLDDKEQVALFAELLSLLICITDRLAFKKFSDSAREEFMDSVIRTGSSSFARQKHFGDTTEERAGFFEHLFSGRYEEYARCSGIMNKGGNSLVVAGSIHLVEALLSDLPESERAVLALKTQVVVSTAVTALVTVDSFRSLLRKDTEMK